MPFSNNQIEPANDTSRSGIWYIYLSLVVVFLYSPYAIDPVLQIRYIALAVYILIGVFVLLWQFRKIKWLYFSGLTFLVFWLIYCVSSIAGIIFAHDRSGDGIFLWLQILMLGLLVFVLTGIFINKASFTAGFLKLFLFIGIVALLVGANQLKTLLLKGIYTHSSLYFITSLFAHKNIFAEILILVFPVALIASFKLIKSWKYFGFFVAVSCFMMIIVLMSKAVWVAFTISLGISLIVLILFYILKPNAKFHFRIRKYGWQIAILLILLIPCTFLMTKPQMADSFSRQWGNIFSPKTDANQDRLTIWKKTLNICKYQIWPGNGLGNWKIEILKEGNKNLISQNNITFYQRPHNDYLWILSEQGLMALIAYLIAFIVIISMCYRLAFYADTAKDRVFYILINFSFISYLVYSFFSFPKERIEHILILSILITIVIIHYKTYFGIKPFMIPKWLMIPLIAILLATVFVGIKRYDSELHLRKAYEQRLIENWPGVVKEIDKAYSRLFKIDFVSTPLMYYKGEADYNLKKFDEAIADFQKAEKVSPFHIHVLNNLGTCFEIKKNHALAIQYFNKALALSVYFEDALFNLSAAYYNQKRYDLAIKTFQKINPETKDPRYLKFAYAVTDQYIKQQIMLTEGEFTRNYFEKIINDPDWAYLIFKKSIANKIEYKEQLLLDIIWTAQEIDKDSTAVEVLKNENLK